jgi:hypothetical protein
MFVKGFNYKPDVLRSKYGITDVSLVPLDMRVFSRMIAKIAHSAAVARLGLTGFNPVLKDILRETDRESRAILPFVGCKPPEPPQPTSAPDTAAHVLDHYTPEIDGTTFVVVEVRLFANFGAPSYMVVVGTAVGQTLPPIPDNPGGVDALPNFYRISFPSQSDPPKA